MGAGSLLGRGVWEKDNDGIAFGSNGLNRRNPSRRCRHDWQQGKVKRGRRRLEKELGETCGCSARGATWQCQLAGIAHAKSASRISLSIAKRKGSSHAASRVARISTRRTYSRWCDVTPDMPHHWRMLLPAIRPQIARSLLHGYLCSRSIHCHHPHTPQLKSMSSSTTCP